MTMTIFYWFEKWQYGQYQPLQSGLYNGKNKLLKTFTESQKINKTIYIQSLDLDLNAIYPGIEFIASSRVEDKSSVSKASSCCHFLLPNIFQLGPNGSGQAVFSTSVWAGKHKPESVRMNKPVIIFMTINNLKLQREWKKVRSKGRKTFVKQTGKVWTDWWRMRWDDDEKKEKLVSHKKTIKRWKQWYYHRSTGHGGKHVCKRVWVKQEDGWVNDEMERRGNKALAKSAGIYCKSFQPVNNS